MIKETVKTQIKIAELFYYFLVFFLCYTASNKLIKLQSFRTNLIKTTLFTPDFADVFSICVIILEIALILLLIFYRKNGLLLSCITFLAFTLYISVLNFKGLYEVCGCGGVLNGLQYSYHLVINITLIIASIFSFLTFHSLNNEK
ncbi:MauE/DoxX family redox-associated membrane protein [Flavobacterium sp. DG2-3]|uniref:MauE/DoxX family redox-associated membrane protein n=1 Tax=Flavobacterium sp. DG2-3 TaxID=3068317 RepID=UPI00273DB341|nr:MauE/DoxX family redox-associated membrane protein [Flavobacterium sp. DG2-3]MDP5201279.1 hypothetical protein [Flavobacterium sp. DG2-3]